MEALAEDQDTPIRSRGKAISSVFGWLIGGLSLFASLYSVSEAYGYAPSYIRALTALGQGLLVLPPITAALRRQMSLLQPWWGPPVSFVAIGLVGALLAHLAEPAGAAKTALISRAVSEATDDLKRGDTIGAQMRVANFDNDKSSNPALAALANRIDEAQAKASSSSSTQQAAASTAPASPDRSLDDHADSSQAHQPSDATPSGTDGPMPIPRPPGLFGGFIQHQAEHQLNAIENQVAANAVKQYELAKKYGTPIDVCVQAGLVSAAFLQAQDEQNYALAKARERSDCAKAGIVK